MLNSNLFRTIAAVITTVIGIIGTIANCSTDASGATVCSATWLTPQMAAIAVTVLGAGHLVLKLISGGLGALIAPTVVVSPSGLPGTVTKAQVESGPKK